MPPENRPETNPEADRSVGQGAERDAGRVGDTSADPGTDRSADPDADRSADSSADREPVVESPTELGGRGWWGAVTRTLREFKSDNLTDGAAALTYYAMLSLFPALLALLSVLGLLGQSAMQTLTANLTDLVPEQARQILTTALENLRAPGVASLTAIGGTALAIWSASGYVAGFMRIANTVYDVVEGRPFWKTLPVRVGLTIALLVMLTAGTIAVVFTGSLAERAADLIGAGDVVLTVWSIAKWPVLLLLVTLMLALLYWGAPNVQPRGFRWVTPGSALAVFLWIAASVGFALYVANVGSYNKTYGALAGIVIFLVWLWISNLAILLGLELDAELQRGRAIQSGHPPDKEPYVPLRDEPKRKRRGLFRRRSESERSEA